MESVIKESTNLYYEIDDCITELLKARLDKNTNKEHETICRMESLLVETMQHLSWLVGELKGNSQIKWHTGEPKESGSYLVTVEGTYETYVTCAFYNCMKGWSHWNIVAWCLLGSIKPYKEDAK